MVAEWRLFTHWSSKHLKNSLADLKYRPINFGSHEANGERVPSGVGWNRYSTQAIVGVENIGKPENNGPFEKAWRAVQLYQFSDPAIVLAHYDSTRPLLGRDMLLEIKSLGLRFLCGTRVNFIRETESDQQSVRGFRYDTLDGHFEAGSEWFLLTKNHSTGEIRFQIHASWKYSKFPNWWSKLGFRFLGQRYQLAWHRLAYIRLRHLLGKAASHLEPVPYGIHLVNKDVDPLANSDLWILKDSPSLSQAEILKADQGEKAHLNEKIRIV